MTLSITDTYTISTSTKAELAKLFLDPKQDCKLVISQLKTLTDLKNKATLALTSESDPVKRVQLLSTIEFSSSLIADRQRRKSTLSCQDIAEEASSSKTISNQYKYYLVFGTLAIISLIFLKLKYSKK